MGEVLVKAWYCDLCKHVWLKGTRMPTHCAKCRQRGWNVSNVYSEPVSNVDTVSNVNTADVSNVNKVEGWSHTANTEELETGKPDPRNRRTIKTPSAKAVQAHLDRIASTRTPSPARPSHSASCHCYTCRPPKA